MFNWHKLGKIFDPTAYPDRSWLKEFAQGPASLVFENFVRIYFSCRPAPDANGAYVSNSAWVDLDRRDLRKILRVADTPVLSRGGCGEFDEFGVYPVSPIRNADKVWLYYGGWTRCESVPFNVAIGLATSRNEGATFESACRGHPVRIFGTCDAKRNYMAFDDFAEVVTHACLRRSIGLRTSTFSHDVHFSEVAAAVCRALGREELYCHVPSESDLEDVVVPFSGEFYSEVGFEPTIDLEEGLKSIVAAMAWHRSSLA